MRTCSLLLAVFAASPVAAQPPRTPPDFGPNVTVFDPTTPAATVQATLDTIFASQESSEFGSRRYAVLFTPGTYDVDARIGFYTQVSGLGMSPDDVVINGGMRADARWRKGNATLNFWRAVENMSVVPAGGFDRWAVSQAAPMRRMHIRGDLVLDDGGWSSGGFLADSRVDGEVRSGSQQQWLTRNSALGSWTGSNWNMVFVGTRHAPANSFPDPPYSTIDFAPVIREKPFLVVDRRGEWKVFVPALRSNARGTLELGTGERRRASAEPVPYRQAGHLRSDDEQRARRRQEPHHHARRLSPGHAAPHRATEHDRARSRAGDARAGRRRERDHGG